MKRPVVFSIGCFILAGFATLYFFAISAYPSHCTYGAFVLSGEAATRHEDPFAIRPGIWSARLPDAVIYDRNLQPPIMLPLFQFFAKLDIRVGLAIWTFGSVLLFAAGTAALMVAFPESMQWPLILLMIASEAQLGILNVGEDFALFFALSVAAICAIRGGRDAVAAVCIGALVAAHPNFGLWPVLLLLAGHRRIAGRALAIAIGLSALPLLLYGPSVYAQLAHAVATDNHSLITADVSLIGFFTRGGHRAAGYVLSSVAIVALCGAVNRKRVDPITIGGLACCAGILFAPLGWYHFLVVAYPCLVRLRTNMAARCATALMFVGPHFGAFVGLTFSGTWANIQFALATVLFFLTFGQAAASEAASHANAQEAVMAHAASAC